jgi:Fur family ferric uptake transcriptional regulator
MPSIEDWAARVGAEHGYTRIDHTVELTGVCADCSRQGL